MMPDVPRVPGVPALSSYGLNDVALLFEDVIDGLFGLGGQQWGIFLDGVAVVGFDSVVTFEYRQDNPVSDYPVEDGGFQSYDKVQLPADIKIKLAAGGSVSNRQQFLASLDAEMNTTDLYDVLTPEQVYVGYNFTHRDLHRNAGNVGLITVDVWFTEIRVTAATTFSNTQQPSEAARQSVGNVQPQTPNERVSQGFADGGWSVQ